MSQIPRSIAVLGGLFLLFAALQLIVVVSGGGAAAEGLVYAILIGIPAIVLTYGGFWLSDSDIHPDGYARIGRWCLGAAGLLLAVVLLLIFNPGTQIDNPIHGVMVGTAMGSVGGLAIGTNEARAITQAREAEYQAAEAERGREVLSFLNSTLRHEVLNGLNVIHGNASQLADELDAGAHSRVEVIEARCEDVADLIDDIRPMARTLTGETEVAEIDLSAMITERVNALRATYPGAAVTADVPTGVSIRANEGFSHALSNLLVNAIQHNDKETPRVDVSVTQREDAIRIAIADNGPGLDEDEKVRVFEGDTTLDSGFGLYMTETMVTHFGGELRIDDNDPTGAVFTVEFPGARAGQ